MKLSMITAKLKGGDPDGNPFSFAQRISGAGDLPTALERTFTVPHCWIVETGDSAAANEHPNVTIQEITENFAVVVAIDARGDYHGRAAHDEQDDIKFELWQGLIGWIPPGYKYPVEYAGSAIYVLTRAYSFYQFNFSVKRDLSEEEGIGYGPFDDLLRIYALAPDYGLDIDTEDGEIDAEIRVDLDGPGG